MMVPEARDRIELLKKFYISLPCLLFGIFMSFCSRMWFEDAPHLGYRAFCISSWYWWFLSLTRFCGACILVDRLFGSRGGGKGMGRGWSPPQSAKEGLSPPQIDTAFFRKDRNILIERSTSNIVYWAERRYERYNSKCCCILVGVV